MIKLINFFKNNCILLLLETLVVIAFCLFCDKSGDIVVDSFREVYISQQILKGKVLYKDIFAIYPPLAYLINALIIKFFNLLNVSALSIMRYCGLISALGIVYYTCKLSKYYLGKFYLIPVGLFLISGFILSPNVFNPFLPYSYGILYGILFILISIDFAINKKYSFAYLFCSLAILCKYEFVLFLIVLILRTRKYNLFKNLFIFALPIIIIFLILVIQGLEFKDILATISIIEAMCKTETLHWFYSIMGLEFRLEHLILYVINFIKFVFPINWNFYQEVIIWALPVILLGTVIRYKNFSSNEKFILLATLVVSLKVFFATTLQSYSVYFLSLILISLFIITPKFLKKVLFVLLIIWSLIVGYFNFVSYLNKAFSLENVINYIKNRTTIEDKVVVYPEGLVINVLANRESDSKFYSLIPLYVEAFGEELIIQRLELIKPQYVVISNYNTSAYFFKQFGHDYGINVLKWIEQNYVLETKINDRLEYKIYKLN